MTNKATNNCTCLLSGTAPTQQVTCTIDPQNPPPTPYTIPLPCDSSFTPISDKSQLSNLSALMIDKLRNIA